MSDEYQLRKDVDRIYEDIYTLQGNELNVYKKEDIDKTLSEDYYDKSEVDVKLSDKQDIIEDTGWQYVDYEDGYSDYDTTHPLRYRRIGKIVHIEGRVKNATAVTPAQSGVIIASLTDSSCYPTYEQSALQQGTDANKFILTVLTDGKLNIARYGTTATNTQISSGSWLHCYITYMVD